MRRREPFNDAPMPESFLVVRINPGLSAPVEAIRQELGRLDADLAFANVRALGALFARQGRVLSVPPRGDERGGTLIHRCHGMPRRAPRAETVLPAQPAT